MDELQKNASSGLRTPSLVGPRIPTDASRLRLNNDRDHEPPEGLLAEYYRVIKRRRSMILLFTALGGLFGFATTVGVLPVFRARTSLDIQNLNADFMNMRAVAPTGEGENASSEAYVQTQIKLLQSDTLRARTVARMKGQKSPVTRGDMLSEMRRRLHIPGDEPLSEEALLDYAAKRVTIKPLGITRLVEVTCDSWNAELSAEFCNTLTRQFADQDREVRWNEAQKTSEWLSRQLADVRESLAQSEKKLEGSTGDDALVLNQGNGNESVAVEKLRELQAELMKAQADRVAKQAQYEISTSGSPDSLPMILDSGQLRDYQVKLEDLRRQVAALVPPLTEANPKVQHLRAEIKELEISLSTEKSNVLDRMHREYEAAKHREALLSSAYGGQEKTVAQDQSKEAQVNMLRREVDSSQQLYQTLLQRVKEAGFASAMQASTIRVVDAARAPVFPIAPRRGTSSGVGILLGLLTGVGFAFFKERTRTVLRAPGEVSKYLNMRELGVIPSATRGLRHHYARGTLQAATAARPLASARLRSDRMLDMVAWRDHASLVAEAYRNTTYSVLLAGREIERAKTFVVSSPNVGEGKTTVTCNLGLALAQAKRRVLLIDGDLRKPRLHKVMGLSNEVGLRNILRGDLDVNLSPFDAFCRQTHIPGLSIISSGSGSEEPSGLLHSLNFRVLLDRLTSEFDIILIDSPPMLHMADARILAGMSNGVILVFRARVTDREAAAAARDLFLEDQVRVLGTILNDFDPLKEGQAQYYGTYYKYRDLTQEAETSKSA